VSAGGLGPASWVFLGFASSDWATIIAAVAAALLAAGVAVAGYSVQRKLVRREQRITTYAEALRAVEDYLEAPYVIRRRDGSASARMNLVRHVSDIQSRIAFHRGWLSLHAPVSVCQAYEDFYRASQREAGPQMTDAWTRRPTRRDRDVPMRRPYARPGADAARARVLESMSAELH